MQIEMVSAGLRRLGFIAIAALAWPAVATGVESVRPASSDDFRAVFATPQDIAEGKRLADSGCARCHGPSGISTAKGVPHIAGQRAAYLHLELRAYKAGKRGKNMMAEAVRFLSEDALFKVAAYYASLEPAQPTQAATQAPMPPAPDPVGAGRTAAASCGGCHGEIGISSIPGMPNLVGLDPKYLVLAMQDYRNGKRKHDMMRMLVAGLSDADLSNIATFYATQKPAKARTPAPGHAAEGKAAAAACDSCHGASGVGTSAAPGLAGQDAQYFAAAMRAYKDGSRDDPLMKGPAVSLSDATARDLAAYYAGVEPQAPKVERILSTSEWVQRCDRCHGVNGNSTDPRLPAIAAQRRDYLEIVLDAYRTGARSSAAMAAMSRMLSEADVKTLAAYYARQKARSPVYVVVPAPK